MFRKALRSGDASVWSQVLFLLPFDGFSVVESSLPMSSVLVVRAHVRSLRGSCPKGGQFLRYSEQGAGGHG